MTDVELATPPADAASPRHVTPPKDRARPTGVAGHALRAAVVMGVLALLLRGSASAPPPARVVELRADAATDAVRLVRAAFAEREASLLVRRSTAAPDALVLDALAAAGAAAPLLAALPTPPAIVQVRVPRLVAERAAAVTFDITGDAGSEERVELRDATGALLDSAVVLLDSGGRASGAFRVRPVHEGWHEWRIAIAAGERSAGGWALAAHAPRVLVAAGPPDAESRFVVRALEEAGAHVELRQPLGRGLTPGNAPATLPATPEALRQTDVVVLLRGAVLDDARRTALVRFTTEYGGGILVAARDPLLPRLGLASGPQPEGRDIDPATLVWDVPADLTPLPVVTAAAAAAVRGVIEPMSAAAGATVAARLAGAAAAAGADPALAARTASSRPPDAVLVLRGAGRGRAAALGLRETWRWRVAAGSVAEHREFWRSLVDWLAPARQPLLLDFPAPLVAAGLPVRAELEYAAERAPGGSHESGLTALLQLRRPRGDIEQLPVQSTGGATQRASVAFVPADTGVHVLALADGSAAGAVRAVEQATHEPVAELALVAYASGGRALAEAALQDTLRALRAGGAHPGWRSAAFGLVLLAALADWLSRRLRGLA